LSEFDESGFADFLREHLADPRLTVTRLKLPGTCVAYRLHRGDGTPLFCKRKQADRKADIFLRSLPSTERLVVRPIGTEQLAFSGESVFVYEWRATRPLAMDEMTERQFSEFLVGYRKLLALMASAPVVDPPRDAVAWMETIRSYCRRFPHAGCMFQPVFKMSPSDYLYPADARLQVTHGDLQRNNFGFSPDGELTFFDFDMMVRAYPTEDLTRYAATAIRHSSSLLLPWRRRCILRRFAQMMREVPCPAGQWRVAINRIRLEDAAGAINRCGDSLKAAVNFWRRDLGLRMLACVVQSKERESLR